MEKNIVVFEEIIPFKTEDIEKIYKAFNLTSSSLLEFLEKRKKENVGISFSHIVEEVELKDAIVCLGLLPEKYRETILLYTYMCAEHVVASFEKKEDIPYYHTIHFLLQSVNTFLHFIAQKHIVVSFLEQNKKDNVQVIHNANMYSTNIITNFSSFFRTISSEVFLNMEKEIFLSSKYSYTHPMFHLLRAVYYCLESAEKMSLHEEKNNYNFILSVYKTMFHARYTSTDRMQVLAWQKELFVKIFG